MRKKEQQSYETKAMTANRADEVRERGVRGGGFAPSAETAVAEPKEKADEQSGE